MTGTRRIAACLVAVALIAGCEPMPTTSPSAAPTPVPTAAPTAPPTTAPTATIAPVDVPLAVATGLENLKAVIGLDELAALATAGTLVTTCGITVRQPALTSSKPCVEGDLIAAMLQDDPTTIALLPPGLVEPATKVLPIAGDGPYGLFGPDLFGDPEARALPYPVIGTTLAAGPDALDPAWLAYDAGEVWTLTNIGSLCSDGWAALQAVTKGRGWHWVFDGGTARYDGAPFPNPNPPPGIDVHPIVDPVGTGNAGTIASIQRRADVAIADHECPILEDDAWSPNPLRGGFLFTVPEAVVPEWIDTLGIDVVYLAANHMSDAGRAGIRSTLELLDAHRLPGTGLGMDLDEALEPAFVDVAGIKVAFVAWNDVGGVAQADADTAGVAWITQANVEESIRRARAGGADVIVCNPQWWGGKEYHDNLRPLQVEQLAMFDEAGCNHVVGSGTHVAGPMLLRQHPNDVSFVIGSPGNYVFGQDFWQNTQEGVISSQTFVGTRMVNVRLYPYVILVAARPALTDPEGDGRYVLQRIWKNSDLDYKTFLVEGQG